MNTKVWYLTYCKGVYHTRKIETLLNMNACMVHMVHTMLKIMTLFNLRMCFLGFTPTLATSFSSSYDKTALTL